MTAQEARQMTLWNRLPDVIKHEIESNIKSNYNKHYKSKYEIWFHESVYPELFKDINNIVLILRDLGYNVQHYPVVLDDGKTDEKLEITY